MPSSNNAAFRAAIAATESFSIGDDADLSFFGRGVNVEVAVDLIGPAANLLNISKLPTAETFLAAS